MRGPLSGPLPDGRGSLRLGQSLALLFIHGDYEVRRELLRANKLRGVERLDALSALLEYLPLTTAAMRRAAELWAHARQRGLPTADNKALDEDVILAAQALTLGVADMDIATTNVGHLSRFASAAL